MNEIYTLPISYKYVKRIVSIGYSDYTIHCGHHAVAARRKAVDTVVIEEQDIDKLTAAVTAAGIATADGDDDTDDWTVKLMLMSAASCATATAHGSAAPRPL
jgi:hypothetical protein